MMIVLYLIIAQTVDIPIGRTNLARRKLVKEPCITATPTKTLLPKSTTYQMQNG